MAKQEAAKKAANEPPERETYTAKQVATRLGTDAKTMRKFFRSDASTVEAVGQGGRYEFPADQLEKIREEFAAWQSGKTPRGPKVEGTGPKRRGSRKTQPQVIVEEDDELVEFEDDDEPSDEEVKAIEEEDDDDDDVIAEDDDDDED